MKRCFCFVVLAGWLVLVSAQTDILLDGEWKLSIEGKEYAVNVPHTYNVMDGLEDYAGEAIYYRTFSMPSEMKGKTVRIHFGGVYHDAIVSVNGKRVGDHLNKGYTPFSMDITDALNADGENLLEVRCSNAYTDKALPYKRSFDWNNDGGIYRSVYLHVSGKQTLRYVHVTPSISGQARFDIRLFDNRINKIKGQLTITNRQTGEKVFDSELNLQKGKKDQSFSTTVTLENVQLWHFDQPNLYDFTFVIPGHDTVKDHFGFREFKLVGKRFVLNGEEVRLPGIESMSGSNPSYGAAEPTSYIKRTVRMMKDLNTTITRFHWVQDDAMLTGMDEMGILAQEELSWWQQPSNELTPELRQTAMETLEEMVEAHYNHPCIFAWGISNEVSNNQKEIRLLADFVRQLDSYHLVDVACNHTHENLEKDPSLVLDIPTWNEYLGTWHGPDQTLLPSMLARIEKALNGRPLFITENGLCEPAYTGGDARRVNDMCYHIKEWQKADFICGYIYFCLEDYRTQMGEEGLGKWRIRRHGVTKVDHTPKSSYYILRQLMSPIEIVEVAPAHAVKNEGSLGAQYEVDVRNNNVQVKLQVKNTIPSYTLRNYTLRYEDAKGQKQSVILPDMVPGETYPLFLNNINARYNFEIVRPNGFSVIEY